VKQVIDGLLYDTEKAEEIGHDSAARSRSDFRWYSESLYKSRKGSFFLAGEGGPMTHWAQPCGDATGGGDGIIPLSVDDAREWCERHDVDAETIQEHFEIQEA
jgi:hypothetical protein